jgi:hypothetical protein
LDDILYIDDSAELVQAAARCGLEAVQFVSASDLVGHLARRGVLEKMVP